MTREELSAIEARLLRLLCQGGTDPDLRQEVLSRLRSYSFRNVHHQVLFDCLRRMPRHKPELIPTLLPARLVQAGFPDFDLAPFLEPHGLTASKVRTLLEKLTGAAPSHKTKAGAEAE